MKLLVITYMHFLSNIPAAGQVTAVSLFILLFTSKRVVEAARYRVLGEDGGFDRQHCLRSSFFSSRCSGEAQSIIGPPEPYVLRSHLETIKG